MVKITFNENDKQVQEMLTEYYNVKYYIKQIKSEWKTQFRENPYETAKLIYEYEKNTGLYEYMKEIIFKSGFFDYCYVGDPDEITDVKYIFLIIFNWFFIIQIMKQNIVDYCKKYIE